MARRRRARGTPRPAPRGRRAHTPPPPRRQPTATAQERQNLALVLGMEGKMGEAEPLMREDLPPEAADANLAYLRSLHAGGATLSSTLAAAAHPAS